MTVTEQWLVEDAEGHVTPYEPRPAPRRVIRDTSREADHLLEHLKREGGSALVAKLAKTELRTVLQEAIGDLEKLGLVRRMRQTRRDRVSFAVMDVEVVELLPGADRVALLPSWGRL
jgi:hypothetical protein